jgi:hypothetical protein
MFMVSLEGWAASALQSWFENEATTVLKGDYETSLALEFLAACMATT